jgi:hypothetical protein
MFRSDQAQFEKELSPQGESRLFNKAMPRDVREKIVYPFTFTSIMALGALASTCQKTEADTAFLRLMTAAIGADPESYKLEDDGSYKQKDETRLAAIAILKRHPRLLFVKGIVTDHFGRKIFASPYQLFLGAGDVWALKQVHEEIISNIKDEKVRAEMQAEAQAQFEQQFPNCPFPFDPKMGEEVLYDDRNIAQIAQIKENLKKVAAVIAGDPCTNSVATLPETKAVVEELRELFAPKQDEVIRTGLHFPIAIMQEIYKTYAVIPAGARSSFFSREVIGAALDASTAVDGQCYKVGLSNLDFEKGPDRRDGLFCRHPKGIPQKLAPLKDKLGRTMFVDPSDGESCFQASNKPGYFDCFDKNGGPGACGGGAARGLLGHVVAMKTYVRAKTSYFQNLCARSEKRRRLDV